MFYVLSVISSVVLVPDVKKGALKKFNMDIIIMSLRTLRIKKDD